MSLWFFYFCFLQILEINRLLLQMSLQLLRISPSARLVIVLLFVFFGFSPSNSLPSASPSLILHGLSEDPLTNNIPLISDEIKLSQLHNFSYTPNPLATIPLHKVSFFTLTNFLINSLIKFICFVCFSWCVSRILSLSWSFPHLAILQPKNSLLKFTIQKRQNDSILERVSYPIVIVYFFNFIHSLILFRSEVIIV